MVRALKTWEHYLIGREFIFYSDCDALKHLNNQTHKDMHAGTILAEIPAEAQGGGAE